MHLSLSSPTIPIGVGVGVGWGFDTREVQSLRRLGLNCRKIPLFIKFYRSCVLILPCSITGVIGGKKGLSTTEGLGISKSIDANFGLKGGEFDPTGDGRGI